MISPNDNCRFVKYYFILLFISNRLTTLKSEGYKVFWHIPTHMCHKYGISFDEVIEKFEMLQNSANNSDSIEIEIINNPGGLSDENPEYVIIQNYLNSFTNELRWRINNEFSGLGILNYTVWQPFFRQNRGPLEYYYNRSIEIERDLYPLFDENQTLELASMRYEFASKNILIAIVNRVQKYWPQATWGFLDYPKCNYLPINELPSKCDDDIIEDNDRLDWLWNLNITLHPSFDQPINSNCNIKQREQLIFARLREARRIANKYHLKIYPFITFEYNNREDFFDILLGGIKALFRLNTNSFIVRGSSDEVDNEEKCNRLNDYLNKTLGPLIQQMPTFFNN